MQANDGQDGVAAPRLKLRTEDRSRTYAAACACFQVFHIALWPNVSHRKRNAPRWIAPRPGHLWSKLSQSAASLEGSKMQNQLGGKSLLSLASECSARSPKLHIKRCVWGWGACRRRETEGSGDPPPLQWVIPPVAASGQVPSAPCLAFIHFFCFHSSSVHGHWETQSSFQPGTVQPRTEAGLRTALSAPTCLSASIAYQNSSSVMVEVMLSLMLKR